jgi:outer membrane protein OmpA-like peptidoglycan-associated protein
VQGGSGQTGDQGAFVPGIAGNAGPSGFQGERGGAGPTGAQGDVGIVERWTTYREFNFDRTGANIPASEMDRVSEIAAYLVQNPSLDVGIDGSMDARTFNQGDRDLSNRRADSVRDALMQAGVPASKIQMGPFADPDRRHEGQIQVLIKTRT